MKKNNAPSRAKPRKDTVKIAGRKFSKDCASVITQVAEAQRQSPTAVIVDVLEGWAKRTRRRGQRSKNRRRKSARE